MDGKIIAACGNDCAACTPEELEIFQRAFFEKEKNLNEERQREK